MNNKNFLRFIKKIYDNSFYPATYNIEKNCLEYPEMPNVYYWPSPILLKINEELHKEIINSIFKKFQINTNHYEK
jgi:hypothetical protein